MKKKELGWGVIFEVERRHLARVADDPGFSATKRIAIPA
jgi:hypothetical protein